jgi:hypothetical protein
MYICDVYRYYIFKPFTQQVYPKVSSFDAEKYSSLDAFGQKISEISLFYTVVMRARPGGLEPPTSGFGDLRSTN